MSKSFVLCSAGLLCVSLLVGCSDPQLDPKSPASRNMQPQVGRGGVGSTIAPEVGPEPVVSASADDCPIGTALSESCSCGGSRHTEGLCCETGFSFSACEEEVQYITEDGAGAQDGSDWANALAGLPNELSRGTVYWLAAGDYGRRTFDDSPAGDAGITLRKATAAAHGTPAGWEEGFGAGPAVFGPVHVSQSRYTLDGGEPGGMKVVGVMETHSVCDIDGHHVVLRQVELNGGVEKNGNTQTAGACAGSNIEGDHVVLDRCEVHNIADDGLGVFADHIRILNSKIHNLHGCGTDSSCSGPCYNGHSDGVEINGAAHIELSGNMIYDVRSTGALFMYGSGNEVADLVAVNNVFYTPMNGITVYLQDLNGAKFYNNVIWGRSQGDRYGGLAIGKNVRGLEMFNNIILNINYSHLSAIHEPKNHQLDYNLFGVVNPSEYTLMPNDVVGDPQFAGIPMSENISEHKSGDLEPSDFLPLAAEALDNGKDLTDELRYDIQGVARPQGRGFDRGVLEVQSREPFSSTE